MKLARLYPRRHPDRGNRRGRYGLDLASHNAYSHLLGAGYASSSTLAAARRRRRSIGVNIVCRHCQSRILRPQRRCRRGASSSSR